MLGSHSAVWLYGSFARGDSDSLSDIDLLHITDDLNVGTPREGRISRSESVSVSGYLWKEIEGMAEHGSLFLHHLRLEGRPLVESRQCQGRLVKILAGLGPYCLASRDVVGFGQVLDDIRLSLADSEASLFYELSTLGTVFRHAAILGCALQGSFCFSRSEPVARIVSQHRLPEHWVSEFRDLYDYRLFMDGRIEECEPPRLELARLWCSRTRVLLDVVGRQVDG